MNCNQAQELVSEALDGALTTAQDEEFRIHLGDCPDCRTFYAEFRESLTFLTELPRVEVGDSFNDAVFAQLRAEEPQRAGWSFNWAALRERLAVAGFPGDFAPAFRWSPLAAAAMLLIVLAVTAPKDVPVERAQLENNGFTTEVAAPSAGLAAPDAPVAQVNVSDFQAPDEFASEMPDAIEQFLQQNGRELRLESGDADRLRRTDYVYPVRRLEPRGQIGTPVRGQVNSVRPVSDSTPAVIAF